MNRMMAIVCMLFVSASVVWASIPFSKGIDCVKRANFFQEIAVKACDRAVAQVDRGWTSLAVATLTDALRAIQSADARLKEAREHLDKLGVDGTEWSVLSKEIDSAQSRLNGTYARWLTLRK